jgi:hypothetical protein
MQKHKKAALLISGNKICVEEIIMKNFFILVLFLTPMDFCFADDNEIFEIQALLKNGLNKNYETIQEKSSVLNPDEKIFLFDTYKKGSAIPFVVNMIAGFGIGSYIQGDIVGGTIQLSGEVLSILTIYSAFIPGPHVETVIKTGAISYLIFRLYGCVSPFVFKDIYNTKLKNALHYNDVSYSIIPSFDENGNGTISAVISFKL